MKICPKCGNTHEKPGTFCSRKCANSHTQSPETNKKRSESNKRSFKKKTIDEYSVASLAGWANRGGKKFVGEYSVVDFKHCTYCETYFTAPHGRSWCSDQCFLEIKRKNWQGNKQRFRNQSFDSSWEVDLLIWLEKQNINFTTKPSHIEWVDSKGKSHRYFPDFYLNDYDLYVDPKNKIAVSQQKEKIAYISSKVKLLYGDLSFLKEEILKLGSSNPS